MLTARLLLLSILLSASAEAAAGSLIEHVFIIVLENQNYESTFGPSSEAPFLTRKLVGQGVLLAQYYGTGHFSLDNYLAMISGQAASAETRDDCETFSEFLASGTTADGQAIGTGCVYPTSVPTLPDQLAAVHKTWRGYMEDMGNDPEREAANCGHPPLNAADPTQAAEAPSARVPAGDQYASRHNPFVYFHSIIDSPECARNVVNFARLQRDLATRATTPNFVFISPNLCHDGHDVPCRNGEPGGLRSADAFLLRWVPVILASPAYRHGGLLVITFDEGEGEIARNPAGGEIMTFAGARCCNQQPGPNLAPFPQSKADGDWVYRFESFGGDRIGAVLLSPYLPAGTVSQTPFNHYSLLKTVEDLLGARGHLGYAGQAGLLGFFDAGSDVPALRRRAH